MQGVVWQVGKWASGVDVCMGLCAMCESHVHARGWVCVCVVSFSCTRDGEGHIVLRCAESELRNLAKRLNHREIRIHTPVRGKHHLEGCVFVYLCRILIINESIHQSCRERLALFGR